MTILIVEGMALVYRRHGTIYVVDEERNSIEVPVPDLELMVLVGERIRITSSAALTLLSHGIPVVFVSGRMETYGVLFDVVQIGATNIRSIQYRCFEEEYCRLKYAKPIIESKLRGFYNVLRYEYKYYKEEMKDYDYVKQGILETIEAIRNAKSIDELRALEAKGSKYFWNIMVNLVPEKYGFTGREPRKGDPINSAIDFVYAVLYGIITKSLVANGLDPFYGLIHSLKSGRLSLVYDVSEIFKPLAIHSILQASRKSTIATFKGSKLLKPKSIEILVKYLYYRLSKESESLYKRKSIWILPMREINKFKDAIHKQIEYKPYIYDPTS